MNETDFRFDTDIAGKNIEHDLKVGFKYHYDYHNRDQQNHNFSQAVGGQITAHSGGATQSDDDTKNERYVGYIEEKAKIDNFELSVGGRFEYMKMHRKLQVSGYIKQPRGGNIRFCSSVAFCTIMVKI